MSDSLAAMSIEDTVVSMHPAAVAFESDSTKVSFEGYGNMPFIGESMSRVLEAVPPNGRS